MAGEIVPPDASAEGDTNLHLNGGADAIEYCGSTAGGLVATNTAKRFEVKSAPAPAGRPLAACSPSGAFLEAAAKF